jgi:hypothetical protein
MISGIEFHPIIERIFGDVRHIYNSEQLQVNCPKCQEREGLFYPDGKYNLEINTRIRKFHCWKCQDPPFKGSLGRLVRMLGSFSDYDEYKTFAGTFFDYDSSSDEKIFEIVHLPKEFILFKNLDMTNPDHADAYMYMTLHRKIPKELIEKYRIGFCVEGRYKNRIIIPSYDSEGELNYFIARSYKDETYPPYLNPRANKDEIIFNEWHLNWDGTLFLVEGGFDFFSFPVNTIPILGKRLPSSIFYKLMLFKPNIIIVLDPDAKKESVRIYEKIKAIYHGEEDKVKIVNLSKNEMDLDEINRNYGKNEIIKQIYNAKTLTDNDYIYM